MRYGMTRLANHQVAHGVAMYVDFAAEAVRVRGVEGPKSRSNPLMAAVQNGACNRAHEAAAIHGHSESNVPTCARRGTGGLWGRDSPSRTRRSRPVITGRPAASVVALGAIGVHSPAQPSWKCSKRPHFDRTSGGTFQKRSRAANGRNTTRSCAAFTTHFLSRGGDQAKEKPQANQVRADAFVSRAVVDASLPVRVVGTSCRHASLAAAV